MWVATDWQHAICDASWCEPLEERDALKRVQPVKTDTMRLLLSVPQTTQAKHVLDLCSGNGVQGIFAAKRYAQKVLLVDVNTRALRFLRFNAILNEVDSKTEIVYANVSNLAPVMVNRPKFDLILANPPYEPDVPAEICKESPTTCTNLATGGGVSGEDINAAIVAQCRTLLTNLGTLRMITLAMNTANYESKLLSWWQRGSHMHRDHIVRSARFVVIYQSIFTSAAFAELTLGFTEQPEDHTRLAERWQQIGINDVATVIINLHKTDTWSYQFVAVNSSVAKAEGIRNPTWYTSAEARKFANK